MGWDGRERGFSQRQLSFGKLLPLQKWSQIRVMSGLKLKPRKAFFPLQAPWNYAAKCYKLRCSQGRGSQYPETRRKYHRGCLKRIQLYQITCNILEEIRFNCAILLWNKKKIKVSELFQKAWMVEFRSYARTWKFESFSELEKLL